MVILKNKALLAVLLLTYSVCLSQKFITRTGITKFTASTESFEPVKAISKSTSVLLNGNGKIAAQLYISTFSFRVALMQEHFNESYMESDVFPKANFEGIIEQFDASHFKKVSHILKGKLTIKRISKMIQTKIELKKSLSNKIMLKGMFIITPQEFNIKIPSIVRKKIADQIIVTFNYELSEKK